MKLSYTTYLQIVAAIILLIYYTMPSHAQSTGENRIRFQKEAGNVVGGLSIYAIRDINTGKGYVVVDGKGTAMMEIK